MNNNNKAPGMDGITAEILKNGGEKMIDLEQVKMYGKVKFLKTGEILVSLYKKGSKSDCSNFRGISLLSIAGKLFSRIILNRLVRTICQWNSTRIIVRFSCEPWHCECDFQCSAIAEVQRTESSIVPMFH